jgi:4'-phosphopantetheinyl transferase EntD
LIEKLLPPGVACQESLEDVPETLMLPAEAAAIANAVAKRRREFATVRYCARRAMASLGVPEAPLLPGPNREPLWPAGVVGSLTHCAGYRAAAVARRSDLAALGIDAEPHGPLPDGVLEAVTLAEERPLLERLAETEPGVHWDRLLFCAKESVYKAWFPLTGRWLGFEQAAVTPLPGGEFRAELRVPGPLLGGVELTAFTGRWLVDADLVLTAVTVPGGNGDS